MNTTPDKAYKYLKVNLDPPVSIFEAGGGDSSFMKFRASNNGVTNNSSEIKIRQNLNEIEETAATGYDGRVLQTGALVFAKVP
jgi:hypothetical protein